MSIEIELQKLLEKNGYETKRKKDGSIWTKGGSVWTLWRGRGSEVNYHNNDTVAFNYLSGYMRDMFKQQENTSELNRDEQEKQFHKILSTLPFYNKIRSHIPPPKWSKRKGIEYFSISSKVGMEVFKEIVDFIVSDSGSSSKKMTDYPVSNNAAKELPEKEDSDFALKQLREKGKETTVETETILNQIEENFAKEGKILRSDWRIITERNIKEHWYK